MKQSDRASPYFGFTEQSVRASPWARVTGQSDRTWDTLSSCHGADCQRLCSQWPVSSDLEQYFASRPQDFQWGTARTEQGIGLLTIPVLAEGGSFGQAKQHLPWTSHFMKNSRCNKWQDLTHWPVQHLQCNTRAWLHCKAEPSEVLSPTADQGGADCQREKKVNWC